MIKKVKTKEYAIREAWPEGISWGESIINHCIYVGDISSLRKVGVEIAYFDNEPSEIEELRRYQIVLPKTKNNGGNFDFSLKKTVLKELIEKFGGLSMSSTSMGFWKDSKGEILVEENIIITCDVPDTLENQGFFIGFKEKCRVRFEQEEIWLTSFPIDRIL